MIQRIQSVYLFLAGIIPAITFLSPLAFLRIDGGELIIKAISYEAANYPINSSTIPWGIALPMVLLMVVNLLNIFCYMNRKRQIRLTGWAIVITVLIYISLITYIVLFANKTAASVSPAPMALAPLISLAFTLLARRAIKKDEALVRAADRIR